MEAQAQGEWSPIAPEDGSRGSHRGSFSASPNFAFGQNGLVPSYASGTPLLRAPWEYCFLAKLSICCGAGDLGRGRGSVSGAVCRQETLSWNVLTLSAGSLPQPGGYPKDLLSRVWDQRSVPFPVPGVGRERGCSPPSCGRACCDSQIEGLEGRTARWGLAWRSAFMGEVGATSPLTSSKQNTQVCRGFPR